MRNAAGSYEPAALSDCNRDDQQDTAAAINAAGETASFRRRPAFPDLVLNLHFSALAEHG